MGYAGGTTPRPTYHDIADHAEAIQLDYDPEQISYGRLLELFWAARRPTRPAWKRQYMSAIFYADAEQRAQAEDSLQRVTEEAGTEIFVEILPADTFYRAEDYHQKYYLQRRPELLQELRAPYPRFEDFVDSTAVARVNGYLGGARAQELESVDLGSMGLSEEAQKALRDRRRR